MVRIIREVRISEGEIIRAVLYMCCKFNTSLHKQQIISTCLSDILRDICDTPARRSCSLLTTHATDAETLETIGQ